ncbi:MAG: glycine cleavage system aminomethyltransferase GcvT, partial [Erysipelotrichaceae bacterium]|nr:glycine cleavage system aminomethyltransferase GcvT [Erysipelotrichaceae bacterium]
EERGEPKITRVGLQMVDRGIMREHQDVYVDDQLIGHTTSGTHCPYLGKPVAMALIDKKYAEIGTRVSVDVRGRRLTAEVVALPFYKRER